MHTGIGEPQARLAQAESIDGVIPELGHGDTVQECADHSPGAVHPEDGDHDPADNAHAMGWKDTKVL